MLPYLNEISTSRKLIQKFYGFCSRPNCPEGYFSDENNLSSDDFPLVTARKPFQYTELDGKINSLCGKDKLAISMNLEPEKENRVIYDGEFITKAAAGETKFVSMGAYLLIFPDKLCYNTYTKELTSLEASMACDSLTVKSETYEGDVSYTKKWVRLNSSEDFSSKFKVGDGVELAYSLNGSKAVSTSITEMGEISGEYYCDVSADTADFENVGTVSDIVISRKIPRMDFLVECDNRVWGCSSENHEIYCCKLGDPANWNCFEGLSTDSYAVTVGSDGEFTGAVSYGGYVLFFKEGCIHKVYGTKPSNFQVTETVCSGIKKGSHLSAAIVEDVLFYHAPEGIMVYDGSYPQLVSGDLGDMIYKNAKGGGYGGKYYVSMNRTSGGAVLETQDSFCYDISRRIWHKWSTEDGNVRCYGRTSSALFCATEEKLYVIGGEETPKWQIQDCQNGKYYDWQKELYVSWSFTTGDIEVYTPEKKHISKVLITMGNKDPINHIGTYTLKIYYNQAKSEWNYEKHIHNQTKRNPVIFPVIPKRCDKMKIRLEGCGSDDYLAAITYTIENNSEK